MGVNTKVRWKVGKKFMQHLGIDIGGTFIKYALIDNEITITKKWKKETREFSTKDEFYDYVCENIDVSNVDCIGVSAPGVIDEDSNVLSKASMNLRIMFHTNVNQEVSSRLLKPVISLNDARAAGFCELKMGNGKNSKSSVYWILGTAIGGCICDHQSIVRGADNIAGEFSHLPIAINDNQMQSLATLASMSALIQIYNDKLTEDQKLQYGTEVCQKYLANDPVAVSAINKWCQNIVMGLYIITIFFNPEIICIGGGISEEDWFIKKIQYMFKEELKMQFCDSITTKIDRCKFNNDANILGAVAYAMKCYCK